MAIIRLILFFYWLYSSFQTNHPANLCNRFNFRFPIYKTMTGNRPSLSPEPRTDSQKFSPINLELVGLTNDPNLSTPRSPPHTLLVCPLQIPPSHLLRHWTLEHLRVIYRTTSHNGTHTFSIPRTLSLLLILLGFLSICQLVKKVTNFVSTVKKSRFNYFRTSTRNVYFNQNYKTFE